MIKAGIRQEGFTFVETIIYVAIIGIVISSFIAFGITISSSRSKTYVVQEVQANTRIAFDLLSRLIRQADIIISPIPGSTSSSMVFEDDGTNIVINVVDGVINITEGAGDGVAITSDEVSITELVFSNNSEQGNRDNIGINLTAQFANPGSIEYYYEQNARTAVSVRK